MSLIAVSVCVPTTHLLSYGDSKTMTRLMYGGSTNAEAYQVLLAVPCSAVFDVGNPVGTDGALARGSHTVAQMKALIDADLAKMGGNPAAILSSLGTVDLVAGLVVTEADFKSDYGYILDAFHAKYPAALIYVAKPWTAGSGAIADTMAGWIDDVVATRAPWTLAGHDERVWAKGSDNGATMMYDGVHYSQAGTVECARQWRTILGL
jgi:hypothetical protein